MSNHQYWDKKPKTPSNPTTVEVLLPDLDMRLSTDRGVFSADRLDRGTRYLLMEGPPPPEGPVEILDLGCGYGPIACALAIRNPQARIWAIDVNERARELCHSNAQDAGLLNVQVVAPEGVPTDLQLDGIWSNPPIRIGKTALQDLLTIWLGRLRSEASAHLVVQRHLGADSLARWLNEQGWLTTRRGSRKGFRLLDVTAQPVDLNQCNSSESKSG